PPRAQKGRRPPSHPPTTAATFTAPTPRAVPQYGSSFVNGASRSSCNGPRLLSHTPITREPFDHAPRSGVGRDTTPPNRPVKEAAANGGPQPPAAARPTVTTVGITAA